MTYTTEQIKRQKHRRILRTLEAAAALAAAIAPYADSWSDAVREALSRLDECFAEIGADELRRTR